jgi:D-3-phosphoglycerate dehydrogenase
MSDPVEPLILDLLEWIGPRARPYAEVLEAWRTSCPRLPIWEEANKRGFVDHSHEQGKPAVVAVSPLGHSWLASQRSSAGNPSPAAHSEVVHRDSTNTEQSMP